MISLPRPEQMPAANNKFVEVWYRFFLQVSDALSGRSAPRVPSVYVNPTSSQRGLPDASDNGLIVQVVDESGGTTLATSFNSQWLRVSDGAVVS